MSRLSIACDAAPLLADLDLLAQAAERSAQVCQRLLDLLDGGADLVCIRDEVLTAGPAGELRIEFEFADGLRDLLAAVRAGEFDGFVVQQPVHGCPSQKVV